MQPEAISPLPVILAHADWSKDARKRWMVQARFGSDGRYHVLAPELVNEPQYLLNDLIDKRAHLTTQISSDAQSSGAILLGFDFPIGLPQAYAHRAGIHDFLQWLPTVEMPPWDEFYKPASKLGEISLWRPFYPWKPGGARQSFLLEAFGMESIHELRRICEHAHPGRRAAAPLFWTLGGQQVGKAAITGWREVLSPGLLDANTSLKIWPFSGTLADCCTPGSIVAAETYPAELYSRLGVSFAPSHPGMRSGKRVQAERRRNAPALLAVAEQIRAGLAPDLVDQILDGFGSQPQGEDCFDALVGLLGMLQIVTGAKPAGDPQGAPFADAVCRIEGWILGQTQVGSSS